MGLASAVVAHELRAHVRRVTGGITMSCGIGDSKLTARLISKRSGQPNSQTLLLPEEKIQLMQVCPIQQVPTLCQQQGMLLTSTFHISKLSEIADRCSCDQLVTALGVQVERAQQLLLWSRGVDNRKVVERGPPQTLMVERSHPPLESKESLRKAAVSLCVALKDRLLADVMEHCRIPTGLVVHWRSRYEAIESARVAIPGRLNNLLHQANTMSKMSRKDTKDSVESSTEDVAVQSLANTCMVPLGKQSAVTRISLTASNFIDLSSSSSIQRFFGNSSQNYKSGMYARPSGNTWVEKKEAEERVKQVETLEGVAHVVEQSTPGTLLKELYRTTRLTTKQQEQHAAALPPQSSPLPPRRIILCIDQDCFYAQVVMIAHPELRQKPLGITQKYLVVTSNYPARERGVTKLQSIAEAQRRCPEIVLVPGERLDVFRNAAREILTTAKLHMNEEMENIGGERVPVQVERSGLDECEWYNLFCCSISNLYFNCCCLH